MREKWNFNSIFIIYNEKRKKEEKRKKRKKNYLGITRGIQKHQKKIKVFFLQLFFYSEFEIDPNKMIYHFSTLCAHYISSKTYSILTAHAHKLTVKMDIHHSIALGAIINLWSEQKKSNSFSFLLKTTLIKKIRTNFFSFFVSLLMMIKRSLLLVAFFSYTMTQPLLIIWFSFQHSSCNTCLNLSIWYACGEVLWSFVCPGERSRTISDIEKNR